jgi:hypothetical protein
MRLLDARILSSYHGSRLNLVIIPIPEVNFQNRFSIFYQGKFGVVQKK